LPWADIYVKVNSCFRAGVHYVQFDQAATTGHWSGAVAALERLGGEGLAHRSSACNTVQACFHHILTMQIPNFEETLEKLLQRDGRYQREAYLFVREALDHTQKIIEKSGKAEVRHVSGQELLEGIRSYALQQYGPMALMLLNEWGVRRCEDFGELVFNMVECQLLAKTEKDSRDDFKNGYTFEDAFRRPFLPSSKPVTASELESPSTELK